MRWLCGVVAVVSCAALAGCAATTRPASDLTASNATLNAAGLTNSTPAHYYFQYSTAPNALGTGFGFQTRTRGPVPANVSGPGGSLLPFSEPVSGLQPNTTYYYRVCGGDGQISPDVCAQTRSFTTPNGVVLSTPGAYSWTVPAGVTRAQFDISGAQGGFPQGGGRSLAGYGAHVRAVLSVHANETLTVVVGGSGGQGDHNTGNGGLGGFNGGAVGGNSSPTTDGGDGGGGASDIRTGAGDASGLATRLLVAGGGGGATGSTQCGRGGAGGPVGQDGKDGCLIPPPPQPARGGGGGTLSAGGTGGATSSGSAGANGALGGGGAGGSNTIGPQFGIGGGGGGGGYFGGGGGGSGAVVFVPSEHGTSSGGGGGGSSLITSTALCSSPVDTGVQTGDGVVTITYNPPAC